VISALRIQLSSLDPPRIDPRVGRDGWALATGGPGAARPDSIPLRKIRCVAASFKQNYSMLAAPL
jgi:hypothetical protein